VPHFAFSCPTIAMSEFIAKNESQIGGVISGFDRLVFRGSLRSLVHERYGVALRGHSGFVVFTLPAPRVIITENQVL
jgi:hypothetical protein